MRRLIPNQAGTKRVYGAAYNLSHITVGTFEVLGMEGAFTKEPPAEYFWKQVGHILNAAYVPRRSLSKNLFDTARTPLTKENIPNQRYLIDYDWGRIYAGRASGLFTYYPHARYITAPIVAYMLNSSRETFMPTEQEQIRVLSIHSRKQLAAFTLWLDKARERLQLAHAMGDYGNATVFMKREDIVSIGADVYKHRGTPQEFVTSILEKGTVISPLPAPEEFNVGTTCSYQDYITFYS